MAYAFSRVNQALGGDAEQENQDIFGGAGQPQQQGVQGQDAAGTTPQGVTKTSTVGAVGGGIAPSSEIKAPQEAAAGGAGAASKILAKNESTAPAQIKGLESKLSGASANLQKEANDYVTSAKNTNYNVGGGDVNELIAGGNTEGAQRASRLLSGTQAPQAERFVPKAQTRFQEVEDLGTEAGISNMLRRQAGARATTGELGIESALLRRDPRFQQTRSQLISKGAQLGAERNRLLGEGAEGVTSQAQAAQAANYKKAQEALRGDLRGARSGIDAEIAAKVAAENEARRAMAAQGLESNQAYRDALAAAKAQYGEAEDPTQFARFGGDVTAADLYDEPSASRYSRISALLGEPGEVRLAGKGAGERLGFDLAGYRGAAETLAAKRIKAAEDARAAEEAKRIALIEKNQGDLAKSKAAYEQQIANEQAEADFRAGIQPGTLQLPTEAPAFAPGISMVPMGNSGPPVMDNVDDEEDARVGSLRL
jgi:hypothetical protein